MSDEKKKEYTGIMYVIVSAVLFGLMPLITKTAFAHGSNAISMAFGRYAFGAAALLFYILIKPGQTLKAKGKELRNIFFLSVPLAVTPVLIYTSYGYIDSGLTTALHFSYPVFVIVLLAIFFRQKPDIRQIICAALCVIGIALFYKPNGNADIRGILIAVLSGLTFSVYIVFLEKSNLKKLPLLTFSFWLFLFAAFGVGTVGLLTRELTFSTDITGWSMMILLALVPGIGGSVSFQKGVFLCGGVKASLFSTFEPLTGLAVGYFVFNEIPDARDVLGVLFILASVVILSLKKQIKE